MIRHTIVNHNSRNIVFRDSALAHEYCRGIGLEIGAAAHNPFHLEGARNVGTPDDFEFYKGEQVKLCGAYAEIDIYGDADSLPLEDNSQNYVLSSHVFEHLPDPIKALLTWNRVIRDGGVVFMIVPHRDALAADKGRSVTTLAEVIAAYEQGYDADSHPYQAQGRRGHYHVFNPASITDIVSYTNRQGLTDWKLVECRDNDDKVGNGFLMVFQVHKPEPVEVVAPADVPVVVPEDTPEPPAQNPAEIIAAEKKKRTSRAKKPQA